MALYGLPPASLVTSLMPETYTLTPSLQALDISSRITRFYIIRHYHAVEDQKIRTFVILQSQLCVNHNSFTKGILKINPAHRNVSALNSTHTSHMALYAQWSRWPAGGSYLSILSSMADKNTSRTNCLRAFHSSEYSVLRCKCTQWSFRSTVLRHLCWRDAVFICSTSHYGLGVLVRGHAYQSEHNRRFMANRVRSSSIASGFP